MFLFQFYHKDDMDCVVKGGPWSFDNALLAFNVIKQGEDPMKVSLVEVDFLDTNSQSTNWLHVRGCYKATWKFSWFVHTV